jgi:cytidine deaminase
VAEAELSRDRLVEAAWEARRKAYAPYSRFAVGAAVRTGSGRLYTGANVENASYGLTMCAERAAVFAAVAAGERVVDAVAVVADTADVTPPCGACRQVLFEFGPSTEIIGEGAGGSRRLWSLDELLPNAFGPSSLHVASPSG